jgi:hypothetical protein
MDYYRDYNRYGFCPRLTTIAGEKSTGGSMGFTILLLALVFLSDLQPKGRSGGL